MFSIICFVAFMLPGQAVQEPDGPRSAGRESREVLVEKLKAEAMRIAEKSPSALLAACTDRSSREVPEPTDEQVRIAGELDVVLRAILTYSLVNKIDKDSPATQSVLAGRFSPKRVEQRAEATRRAEAIALVGLLSPSQSSRWLSTHKTPAPSSPVRYPASKFLPWTDSGSLNLTNLRAYLGTINGRAQGLANDLAFTSHLFQILKDPEEQRRLGLNQEQVALIRQLDAATRAVIRSWLLRAIDPARQLTPEELEDPATAEMVDRFSAKGLDLQANLVAHA